MKKPQPKAKLFEEVPDYLLGKGGVGLSHRLSDNAFWLEDIPSFYIELLDQLDSTKDPKLLLPLLKVPKAAMPHFADLFDRHTLKSRSRRSPSYRRTNHQASLLLAVGQVLHRRRGTSREEAITEAARDYRIDRDALTLALKGQHRSLRKAGRNKSQ